MPGCLDAWMPGCLDAWMPGKRLPNAGHAAGRTWAVNTVVTRITPWTHGADYMDVHVRQDQPEGGAPLAAAEADLRDHRGRRGRPVRRSGRLGGDGTRLVRDLGARL